MFVNLRFDFRSTKLKCFDDYLSIVNPEVGKIFQNKIWGIIGYNDCYHLGYLYQIDIKLMGNFSKIDFPTWGEGGIMHPIPRTVLIEIPLIFP